MKNLFLLSFILFTLVTGKAEAQSTPIEHTDTKNYVVLTRKVPQLKPILLAAKELSLEDGSHFGDFQVVICGKTVQQLTDKNLMKEHLQKAKAVNVNLKACGFSLKKFDVSREDLPAGIQVVENGILHNLQLQKKGYLSLEL